MGVCSGIAAMPVARMNTIPRLHSLNNTIGTIGRSNSSPLAVLLGSAATADAERQALSGAIPIVYATPEKLTSEGFIQQLKSHLVTTGKLAYLAVDEAHCISQWGHDFRPSYRRLGMFRSQIGASVPIMTLTATATGRVKGDIQTAMELRSPFLSQKSVDRPNLNISVFPRSTFESAAGIFFEESKRAKTGSTIIYCISRKECEAIQTRLQAKLPQDRVACYHAGMTLPLRQQSHHDFKTGRARVIVATSAFVRARLSLRLGQAAL